MFELAILYIIEDEISGRESFAYISQFKNLTIILQEYIISINNADNHRKNI